MVQTRILRVSCWVIRPNSHLGMLRYATPLISRAILYLPGSRWPAVRPYRMQIYVFGKGLELALPYLLDAHATRSIYI